MKLADAKACLDKVINAGKLHLYKPIQAAEVLHRDREIERIDFLKKESYRIRSKAWRDPVAVRLVGRTSSSSAKYQDNLFDDNALPPEALATLATANRPAGVVEAYIYWRARASWGQFEDAISFARDSTPLDFDPAKLMSLFVNDRGVKRGIDKIFEILVWALVETLVSHLGGTVTLSFEADEDVVREFQDFADEVLGVSAGVKHKRPAAAYRVGVTNAADRGVDTITNFGAVFQVKHRLLDNLELEKIVAGLEADHIVIFCKGPAPTLSKVDGVQVFSLADLGDWYERALRGPYSAITAEPLLKLVREEMAREFPGAAGALEAFLTERAYFKPEGLWKP